MQDLGTLPGGNNGSGAIGINVLGQVVGFSDCPGCSNNLRAFLWTPSAGMEDLGTLPGSTTSAASGINARRQVVGDLNVNPFLWTPSQGMQDLNNLIPADSGFTLRSANAINARGQIVGNGSINSRAHGYLLTPNED